MSGCLVIFNVVLLTFQVLLENAGTDTEREKIRSAYQMLVDPKKMGERFKFMAFYPSAAAEILEKHPPLGFSIQKT